MTIEKYTEVSYDADERSFSFTDAVSRESWIASEHAELVSARGRAELSSDGEISVMYYDAQYLQGEVLVSAQYTVTVDKCTLTRDTLGTPTSTGKISIDDIDTAVYLRYAYVMLDAELESKFRMDDLTIGSDLSAEDADPAEYIDWTSGVEKALGSLVK